VNDIVRTSLRLAKFDKSFQDLTVVSNLAAGLPEIVADEDQLQQVFLNLFLNARDAMPDGGTLTVTTRLADDTVCVEIADTGTGIPNESKKAIFDPFFTTKAPGRGTGLGLAVCYAIITGHNGSIDVSNNLPPGTRFTVSLPVQKDVTERRSANFAGR
jgi:two-component system NtrC family sensor kinase